MVPMLECCLQHDIGTNKVGLNEILRTINRTVNMRLSREVHNDVRIKIKKAALNHRRIADIAAYEPIARIIGNGRKRGQRAGIGQAIKNHNLMV